MAMKANLFWIGSLWKHTFDRVNISPHVFALLLDPFLHPFASHPKISQGWQSEPPQLAPALAVADAQTC